MSEFYEKLLREAARERSWGWNEACSKPTVAKMAERTPELDLIFGRWP